MHRNGPLLNEALQLVQVRSPDSAITVLREHHPDLAHTDLVAAERAARAASVLAGGIVEEELAAVAGSARSFEEAETRGRQRIRAHVEWIDGASLDLVWGINQVSFLR